MTNPHPEAARAASPPRAVALAGLSSSVDRFGVSPILVMLAMDFGVPLSVAVTVASTYFLTYGISQPFWGLLSDRFGRLAIMRVALICAGVCGLASAFATDLVVLTIARALTGAFFGAIVPAAITYVGDTTRVEHRQSAMSDLMAAIAVGTALATAAAGILGELTSWRWVFAVSAVLALGIVPGLFRLTDPGSGTTQHIWAALRAFFTSGWALLIVCLAFIEGALVLGVLTLLPAALESEGVSSSLAGLTVAAYGLATIGFSRLVRPLSIRLSPVRMLALGGIGLILGLSVIALQVNMVTVVLAALCLGGTWAFMHTGLQAWVTQVVPSARGVTVAFFAGMLFAGSAVSTSLGAVFAEAGRWNELFGLAAVLAILLTALATLTLRKYLRAAR